MKTYILLFVLILFPITTLSQGISWFGPQAGFGFLSNNSNIGMKAGIHSAFGWQLEVPYSSGDLTGYGEGGFMFLGIEQGEIYPYAWGYFGCRYKAIGGGLGPAFNPAGTGLGMNLYYNFFTEKLRIPIGIDCNFVGHTKRIQFFIGFRYK